MNTDEQIYEEYRHLQINAANADDRVVDTILGTAGNTGEARWRAIAAAQDIRDRDEKKRDEFFENNKVVILRYIRRHHEHPRYRRHHEPHR